MEPAILPDQVHVGRDICGNLSAAESREVLVTNGIGGYGSLTLANTLTRSYHGLLIAALRPPLDRMLLLSKVNETALYMGKSFPLYADRRTAGDSNSLAVDRSGQTVEQTVEANHQTISGFKASSFPEGDSLKNGESNGGKCLQEVIAPEGFKHLNSFHLSGTVPVFQYSFQDAILEKKIWMKRNENTVYITYHLKQASQPVLLHLDTLVNFRSHHERTSATEARFNHSVQNGPNNTSVKIRFVRDQVETNLCLVIDKGRSELVNEWITGFVLSEERARGYPERDDHLHAVTFKVELLPTHTVTFLASTECGLSTFNLDGQEELALHQAYEAELLMTSDGSIRSLLKNTPFLQPDRDNAETIKPPLILPSSRAVEVTEERSMEFELKQLVLAANQFIISRGSGYSVLAGYHWFSDWTRDTMISLPGLTIATGRFDVARSVLETYSTYVCKGMLPNRFPDDGSAPKDSDYNNVDGTLWFLEAIRSYYAATSDVEFIKDIFPVLQDIIENHCKGTRYGMKQDEDGLLSAGTKGLALTWMDAVADVVYTQRDGKPVEVAALWYNALKCMSLFASVLGLMEESKAFSKMAEKTEQSFQKKFWNRESLYCYDVVDGGPYKNENDASLRPNQLIAASLHWSPLSLQQCSLILKACSEHLLTPRAIRSLSPKDEKYKGVYEGDVYSRDSSYHQGVGWTWLIGPYLLTKCKVLGDKENSRRYLKSLLQSHLSDACMGQISELFDGEAPYKARGCIAQAWSVGQLLQAMVYTKSFETNE